MSKIIKYEMDGKNCLTNCQLEMGAILKMGVASSFCQKHCGHFISINKESQEVECSHE